ncbi:MAG: penicillin acylase family protein [Phycisphaera sp.]|nr:penicillin acylase family protein [Phycisphaera sp.]
MPTPHVLQLLLATLIGGTTSSAPAPPPDRAVMPGLGQEVRIELDHRAVPTIEATDPLDVHSGLGWMHGRERFFQMDIARRSAAGELAALIGPAVVAMDRDAAMSRRREIARRIVGSLPDSERTLLAAYVRGVNAGIASLDESPIEYRLLNASPKAWNAEDSMLVVLSMFDQLQRSGDQEPAVFELRNRVDPGVSEWMLSVPGRWDALLVPSRTAESTPPSPPGLDRDRTSVDPALRRRLASALPRPVEHQPGSNSFAVAGSRTRDGRAIVANDPHLAYFAPGIWYRAGLRWPGVDAIGLTLPGVPGLPVGSTDSLAWGLTNTTGDFEDLVIVEIDPDDPSRYRVEDGYEPFDDQVVTIEVAGARNVELTSRFTRWGPVLDSLPDGRPIALLRACDQPGAVDLGVVDLLETRDLDTALDVAAAWGGPSQNVLLADRQGRIGWTLSGFIPDRRGYDGLSPVTHLDGRGWFGPLPERERPRLSDPSSGILFTANNRLVPLPAANRIGKVWADGGRAWRIRADLEAIETIGELDLLAVQLDETVQRFLPYRDLLIDSLGSLDPSVPGRDDTLALVQTWDGRASMNDTATPVVESFRRVLQSNVRAMLLQRFAPSPEPLDPAENRGRLEAASAIRSATVLAALEGHDPRVASETEWRALLEEAAQTAIAIHIEDPETPWSERNRSSARHPLGQAHPLVGDRFDLPAVPQPGHWGAVRVQARGFGASARFIAAPGHLDDGILTTPGGQSGRPGTPHYDDLHSSWAAGAASPLLPGSPVRSWILVPTSPSDETSDARTP